jgi:hypothetical protein
MRGLTLLQDGIPINLADDNGDFQELEPIFFDHLEVYRGANALRFGSGTLGGAVNGVTPTGIMLRGYICAVMSAALIFIGVWHRLAWATKMPMLGPQSARIAIRGIANMRGGIPFGSTAMSACAFRTLYPRDFTAA